VAENATGKVSDLSRLDSYEFFGSLRAMLIAIGCNVSEIVIQYAV
jgi:hypothetical protein